MKDMGSFKWLSGDVNYLDHGGKWIRRVPATRRYHVIELNKWASLVGEREAKASGLPKYNLTLKEVDLDLLIPDHTTRESKSALAGALRSCGWYLDPKRGVVNEADHGLVCAAGPVLDEVLVDACHGAGAAAPLKDRGGSDWLVTFEQLRRYSRTLDTEIAHDAVMASPVNAIGTSAQDYMLGKV